MDEIVSLARLSVSRSICVGKTRSSDRYSYLWPVWRRTLKCQLNRTSSESCKSVQPKASCLEDLRLEEWSCLQARHLHVASGRLPQQGKSCSPVYQHKKSSTISCGMTMHLKCILGAYITQCWAISGCTMRIQTSVNARAIILDGLSHFHEGYHRVPRLAKVWEGI